MKWKIVIIGATGMLDKPVAEVYSIVFGAIKLSHKNIRCHK